MNVTSVISREQNDNDLREAPMTIKSGRFRDSDYQLGRLILFLYLIYHTLDREAPDSRQVRQYTYCQIISSQQRLEFTLTLAAIWHADWAC